MSTETRLAALEREVDRVKTEQREQDRAIHERLDSMDSKIDDLTSAALRGLRSVRERQDEPVTVVRPPLRDTFKRVFVTALGFICAVAAVVLPVYLAKGG